MKLVKVDDVIEKLPTIAETLRCSGIRVGTSQLVEAAKIIKSYSVLKKNDVLELDEVKFLLSSVLALDRVEEKLLNDILDSLIYVRSEEENFRKILNEINEDLKFLKIKPDQRVVKKTLFGEGRARKEKIATYLKLKNVGIIQGRNGKERVVSRQRILEISRLLAKRGFSSLEEAFSSIRNLEPEDLVLGAETLNTKNEILKEIGSKRLIKIGKKALRKGDKRLLSAVAEELNNRMLKGAVIKDKDVINILSKAGISVKNSLKRIALKDPRSIVESDLPLEEKLKIINSLPEEKAAEALSKILKRVKKEEELDRIISETRPTLLWAIRFNPYRGKKAEFFSAAINAARGLRESLIYAETGNEGRAEMALYLAEKSLEKISRLNDVKIGSLTSNVIEAMATLTKNIVYILNTKGEVNDVLERRVLLRLPVSQGIVLLRNLYRKADPVMKKYLIKVTANYLFRFSSKEGLRLLPRKELSPSGPGRVHVKYSVLRLTRYAEKPLIYVRRLKSRSISLALDLSGSMLEFSMWALSVAMLFARSIEKLTLFSHEVRSIRGPFSNSELAELLLSLEFKGYTDLFNAIVEACDTRSRRVVVVSDIKQTVKSGDPVEAVERCRRGTKLIFITPPSYDSDLAYRLELAGSHVIVAYKPQDIVRETLRFLVR